jgi:hypothetical protein
MKYVFGLFLIISALNGSSIAAEDTPKAVVERAIAAIGGPEKVGDLKAGTWKTSGTFQGRPSHGEFHGELPG